MIASVWTRVAEKEEMLLPKLRRRGQSDFAGDDHLLPGHTARRLLNKRRASHGRWVGLKS